MLNTVRAVIRDGKVEFAEKIDVPDGTEFLVTIIPDDDAEFWFKVSQSSLGPIWENPEDDLYADLLEE